MNLIQYKRYTRKEVHDIFNPNTNFTVGAGEWGISGIVKVNPSQKDYIFFVTLGQKQADHEFKEDIDEKGILTWQSQPQQNLRSSRIMDFIHHDPSKNNIYLFLREEPKKDYIYFGLLGYVSHDPTKENPVYFKWQLLDWKIDNKKSNLEEYNFSSPDIAKEFHLIKSKSENLEGNNTPVVTSTKKLDIPKNIDFEVVNKKNTKLGNLGEDIVVEYEKKKLIKAGRKDLAKKVIATRNVIGNIAKFDIYSYEIDGTEKYIEVKTTTGECDHFFHISETEVQCSYELQEKYYLYRLYHLDLKKKTADFQVLRGCIDRSKLISTNYIGKFKDLVK